MTPPRIDSHQHFWSLARGDYGWLTPALAPIYRDFAPADLAPELEALSIDRTILVQAAPTLAETEHLLGIAATTPWVAGVVGWVDFEARDAPGQIRRLAAQPKLVGVRPMIQDIADDHWMLRRELDAAFGAVIEAGLAFDALVLPRHLTHLRALLRRHPGLRAVIDHGAKPRIADRVSEPWATDITAIAAESTACCKLSGLATEARQGWSEVDLGPYVGRIVSAFGADRVMWGSDWPVLLLAGTYRGWHDAASGLIASLDVVAQARIMGGTAAEFYRLTNSRAASARNSST